MSTTITQELKIENQELLRQYQQFPSHQLRNQLVKLNVGLVRKEVYLWLNRCQETYDDLLQVGCIGLIRAIERFDLSKGRAFSSFAIPYIRGEIQHYLRDKSPSLRIPRNW
ncbi:MAG: sigma-70 family RNA polymerase sigma factor, partial [Trichodesmium sp. St17_bin3_1_1]|nr:sigma-70 family RNA polymerase sigma factor [Trichodesmium sp. St17_bin3_1_1]MDE5110725.1 sigma-70 family RNA polymerase sigma factor [Trichodesmium sp. St7_bin2_1]